jgi:hypothetical protein
MAIGTSYRNDYVGNATTGTYAYGFKINADSELKVIVTDSSGSQTVLTLNATPGYTVTGAGVPSGGTIVLSGTPAWLDSSGRLKTGYSLSIERNRPFSQTTDLKNQTAFFPQAHEDTFDQVVMLAQRAYSLALRAVQLQEGLNLGGYSMVLPKPVASKAIGWNASGDTIVNMDVNTITPSSMDSVNVTFLASGAGAVSRSTRAKARDIVSVMDFGAVGDGITDDTAAFTTALAAHNTIYVPPGTYKITSSIALSSGKTIFTLSRPERWRSAVYPVKLNYTGAGTPLFTVTPAAGTGIEAIFLKGLHLDGTGASGNSDGISFDATAAGATYIEGVFLEDCAITNFPRYQVRSQRTVFDIDFQRVTMHNAARAADNLVHVTHTGVGGAPGQWTFTNCWLMPYTTNKWAFFAGRDSGVSTNAISEVRFIGGTVAPYDSAGAGAHGVWVYGGIHIEDTHFEGASAAQTASIGVRYTGSNGALIFPSQISVFGRGVEIGNPNVKTTEALGAQLGGAIGFNNYAAGGKDCVIVDGGSRAGTMIDVTGFFTTQAFTLQNDRETIDGNRTDLRRLFTNDNTASRLSGPIGIGTAPSLWLELLHANNNGIRGKNSSNSSRIAYQLLADASDLGFLGLYDAAEVQKLRLLGSGRASLNDGGAAAEDASAILTLTSTTRGLLPPRMTTAQRNAIGSPTAGLIIYNTDTGKHEIYNGAWITMSSFTSGTTGAIATGATVTHGLGTTPGRVLITAQDAGPTDIYVTAKGATTFVINYGGGGTHVFDWIALI